MICTATMPAPGGAVESERPIDGWVSLAAAARMAGLHETTILRLALAGDVRHRVRGRRIVFALEDVRKAAS